MIDLTRRGFMVGLSATGALALIPIPAKVDAAPGAVFEVSPTKETTFVFLSEIVLRSVGDTVWSDIPTDKNVIDLSEMKSWSMDSYQPSIDTTFPYPYDDRITISRIGSVITTLRIKGYMDVDRFRKAMLENEKISCTFKVEDDKYFSMDAYVTEWMTQTKYIWI